MGKSLPCNSWSSDMLGDEPTPIIVMKPKKTRKTTCTMKAGGATRTMTKAALVKTIAKKHGMKKQVCSGIVQSLATLAATELKRTGVFTIPGLCRVKTHAKPATMAGVKRAFGREVNVKAKPARLILKARTLSAFNAQI